MEKIFIKLSLIILLLSVVFPSSANDECNIGLTSEDITKIELGHVSGGSDEVWIHYDTGGQQGVIKFSEGTNLDDSIGISMLSQMVQALAMDAPFRVGNNSSDCSTVNTVSLDF